MKYWMSALLWLPPTVLTRSTLVWMSDRVVLQQRARALHQVLLRDAALVDVRKAHVDRRVVHRFIRPAARRQKGVLHARKLADILRDALREVGGGGQRGALRRAHQHVVLRCVVRRQEVLAHERRTAARC